ncbi:MAG: hypothetical protein ACRDZ4_08310 [Egibacteraceae bacterium]
MTKVLIVSTPALLEARNLARWIGRERIRGVTVGRAGHEWGVFAPAAQAVQARLALRKVVAANNPGPYTVVSRRLPTTVSRPKRFRKFRSALSFAQARVDRHGWTDVVIYGRNWHPIFRTSAIRRRAFRKNSPEQLAQAAAQIAMRGAREYLNRHSLKADPAALSETLRSWVKIKLPEALKDAKDAIEAGMHQIAEQTFAASMFQAGIEAAKEASKPGASANRRSRANPTDRWGPKAPYEPQLSSPTRDVIVHAQRRLAKHGIKSRVHFHKGDWYLFVRDRDRDRAQGISLEHVPQAAAKELRRRFYRRGRHPERAARFHRKEVRKRERGILS